MATKFEFWTSISNVTVTTPFKDNQSKITEDPGNSKNVYFKLSNQKVFFLLHCHSSQLIYFGFRISNFVKGLQNRANLRWVFECLNHFSFYVSVYFHCDFRVQTSLRWLFVNVFLFFSETNSTNFSKLKKTLEIRFFFLLFVTT